MLEGFLLPKLRIFALPKVKMKMKDSLDRFYTKPEIAKHCIKLLTDVVGYNHTFIEPSAGNGSFFLNLPENKIGVDLSPKCDGVVEGDWLTFVAPTNCVVVGNPPFGQRNSLTKAFIKRHIFIVFVLIVVFRLAAIHIFSALQTQLCSIVL